MHMSDTGTEKLCVICGEDCSTRPRIKDKQGRYACRACYERRANEADAMEETAVDEEALSEEEAGAFDPGATGGAGGTASGLTGTGTAVADFGIDRLMPEDPGDQAAADDASFHVLAAAEQLGDLCAHCGAPIAAEAETCAACGRSALEAPEGLAPGKTVLILDRSYSELEVWSLVARLMAGLLCTFALAGIAIVGFFFAAGVIFAPFAAWAVGWMICDAFRTRGLGSAVWMTIAHIVPPLQLMALLYARNAASSPRLRALYISMAMVGLVIGAAYGARLLLTTYTGFEPIM